MKSIRDNDAPVIVTARGFDDERRDSSYPDDAQRELGKLQERATVISDAGALEEAKRYWYQCLAISRELFGEEHLSTVFYRMEIGKVATRLKHYAEALNQWTSAYHICQSVLGDEHKTTFFGLTKLAFCLDRLGLHREAERYWQTALRISKSTFGPVHKTTRYCLKKQGISLIHMGRRKSAAALWTDHLGSVDEDMIDHLWSTLTANLLELRKSQPGFTARHWQQLAYKSESVYGIDHKKTLFAIMETARCHSIVRRNAEAVHWWTLAASVSITVFGRNHKTSEYARRRLEQAQEKLTQNATA